MLQGAHRGLERGLVDDLRPGAGSTYNRDLLPAAGTSMDGWNKVDIKQTKIVLDQVEQTADGKPVSKGYGFVEFSEHVHALACLRELNNNPLPEYTKCVITRHHASLCVTISKYVEHGVMKVR